MKKLFAAASLILIFYVAVAMLGHAAQLADVADRIHPGAGIVTFWILIALLYGGPLFLVGMFFSLPKPLIPPEEAKGPEHDEYIQKLAARLTDNPLLKGARIESLEEVEAAVAKLAQEANKLIRDTASAVFVSTAVLQNGRMDGLIVLATQLRLVWRISRIFDQRPSPRQLISLYGNVSANVLIADSIQEVDFTEISTPIVTSIFPSLKGAIPGLEGISSLLVNSMANGTANAFLTLRIGIAARIYSEATTKPSLRNVRNSTTVQALVMVKDIAKEQGTEISRRAWESLKGVFISATEKTVDTVKTSAKGLSDATVHTAKTAKDRVIGSLQSMTDSVTKRREKNPDDDRAETEFEKAQPNTPSL